MFRPNEVQKQVKRAERRERRARAREEERGAVGQRPSFSVLPVAGGVSGEGEGHGAGNGDTRRAGGEGSSAGAQRASSGEASGAAPRQHQGPAEQRHDAGSDPIPIARAGSAVNLGQISKRLERSDSKGSLASSGTLFWWNAKYIFLIPFSSNWAVLLP